MIVIMSYIRQKMAPLTTYEKTDRHNTNYYRRNKVERFCVLSCPMCSYETTGPKSSLKAHIWSKHTAEEKNLFNALVILVIEGLLRGPI